MGCEAGEHEPREDPPSGVAAGVPARPERCRRIAFDAATKERMREVSQMQFAVAGGSKLGEGLAGRRRKHREYDSIRARDLGVDSRDHRAQRAIDRALSQRIDTRRRRRIDDRDRTLPKHRRLVAHLGCEPGYRIAKGRRTQIDSRKGEARGAQLERGKIEEILANVYPDDCGAARDAEAGDFCW